MIPASIITKPEGKPENIKERNLNSKVFNMGGRKKRLVRAFGLIHYKKNLRDFKEEWKEIDLTPQVNRATISVDKAPYQLTVNKKWISLDYTSRQGGFANFCLIKIDGVDFNGYLGEPRIEGTEIWWDNVAPETDIYLAIKPGGAEFYKRLRGENSASEFTWLVEHDIDSEFTVSTESKGMDTGKRKARITNRIIEREVVGAGRRQYLYVEKFEKQTAVKNKVTRQLTWEDIVNYPVRIDVDITENITGTGDDGQENQAATTWNNSWNYSSTEWIAGRGGSALQQYQGGLRFQSIAVGQGNTIDLANLKITITATPGTPSTQIYGNDIDDAGIWNTANLPSNATKTTAKAAFAPNTNGQKTIDVTTVVQEIVNRGSWVSGNDLAFIIWNTDTNNHNYFKAYDYNKSQAQAAILEIDFTVPSIAALGNKIEAGFTV